MLVGQLTPDQIERLQKVFSLADQRKAAAGKLCHNKSNQHKPNTFHFSLVRFLSCRNFFLL